MMARSRRTFGGRDVRRVESACACRRVSQLPDLTPVDFALFTRATPEPTSFFQKGGSKRLWGAAGAGGAETRAGGDRPREKAAIYWGFGVGWLSQSTVYG